MESRTSHGLLHQAFCFLKLLWSLKGKCKLAQLNAVKRFSKYTLYYEIQKKQFIAEHPSSKQLQQFCTGFL